MVTKSVKGIPLEAARQNIKERKIFKFHQIWLKHNSYRRFPPPYVREMWQNQAGYYSDWMIEGLLYWKFCKLKYPLSVNYFGVLGLCTNVTNGCSGRQRDLPPAPMPSRWYTLLALPFPDQHVGRREFTRPYRSRAGYFSNPIWQYASSYSSSL